MSVPFRVFRHIETDQSAAEINGAKGREKGSNEKKRPLVFLFHIIHRLKSSAL
ncbi:hypothetical protein CHCC15381_2539 [Bacillus paralicheniformis]|uniref:Uncharacterized protein n=1 Tax=Bacillus paralicheniformis TaxID=1648923 RepID=A0ABY3FTF1_9BACI|nr:hypothetical protein CHCC15381_2539 [Bacillus paralicheniformis]